LIWLNAEIQIVGQQLVLLPKCSRFQKIVGLCSILGGLLDNLYSAMEQLYGLTV